MNPKSTRYYTYIRPVMRNKFARTYSPLIFSLVTIAIFSFYAIRPTVTTILSLQKSITEQTDILNRLKDKVKNLSEGNDNYVKIEARIKNKIENLVPPNPALPQLINSLNYIALQSEASISGLQFEKIELTNKNTTLTRDAPTNKIEFTFITQGSFANLMRFLDTLKKSDRLINIKSVNFIQPPDSSLVMTILAEAYYLKN